MQNQNTLIKQKLLELCKLLTSFTDNELILYRSKDKFTFWLSTKILQNYLKMTISNKQRRKHKTNTLHWSTKPTESW